LQQLLELLDEIDGAADNGCLVALHMDWNKEKNSQGQVQSALQKVVACDRTSTGKTLFQTKIKTG
jgi:hypothetical protein